MKNKGFTLIEMMIALAIFAIFSVYLYQTFFSQVRQSFSFNNNIDIQRNVNKALTMLTDEIRSSTNVTLNPSGNIVATQVLSSGNVIIDLNSNSSNSEIYYNSGSKLLSDKNGNECYNITSIQIIQGTASDNENELIKITVSAEDGNLQYTSSTAVNIKK